MGKTFRDNLKALNRDLNRDLKNMEIKKRVTFHKGTKIHDDYKVKNRYERRQSKIALRREIW